MSTVTIGTTTKGARVWLQGLFAKGWTVGDTYYVDYGQEAIIIIRSPEGKRKITASKGGVIDLVSQKVTKWAQGHDKAFVSHVDDIIIITRAH